MTMTCVWMDSMSIDVAVSIKELQTIECVSHSQSSVIRNQRFALKRLQPPQIVHSRVYASNRTHAYGPLGLLLVCIGWEHPERRSALALQHGL